MVKSCRVAEEQRGTGLYRDTGMGVAAIEQYSITTRGLIWEQRRSYRWMERKNKVVGWSTEEL